MPGVSLVQLLSRQAERYIYHPQTFMPELHSSIPYSSTKLIALSAKGEFDISLIEVERRPPLRSTRVYLIRPSFLPCPTHELLKPSVQPHDYHSCILTGGCVTLSTTHEPRQRNNSGLFESKYEGVENGRSKGIE